MYIRGVCSNKKKTPKTNTIWGLKFYANFWFVGAERQTLENVYFNMIIYFHCIL